MSLDPYDRSPAADDERVDARPFLSIPYWLGPPVDDGGRRPLPADVPHHLCASITAEPYEPGRPFAVTVDVADHGPGNDTIVATVRLFWADPNVLITNPTPLGSTTVAVAPRGGIARTPVITAMIPMPAPPEIALLAQVGHRRDPPGARADPIGDRHWAQRNIESVRDD